MVGESDYTIHDNLNMVGESDCTIQVHVGEESAPKKQHTYNYIYNLYTTKVWEVHKRKLTREAVSYFI